MKKIIFLFFVLWFSVSWSAPAWAGSLTGPQKNAVRSAKNYLRLQGFSCNGLIQQLSSSAGDNFTLEQATYGAQQTNACR